MDDKLFAIRFGTGSMEGFATRQEAVTRAEELRDVLGVYTIMEYEQGQLWSDRLGRYY